MAGVSLIEPSRNFLKAVKTVDEPEGLVFKEGLWVMVEMVHGLVMEVVGQERTGLTGFGAGVVEQGVAIARDVNASGFVVCP
jgi:hypothetical protein